MGPIQPFGFRSHLGVSVISNIGTAMFDTASGWLITSIDPNPMMVSLVQVAVSLPLFLFTLPAGALDVLDSRRLLIAVETAILAVSVLFAGLVSVGLATPTLLLAFTFLLG
jgi:hypothetical protein